VEINVHKDDAALVRRLVKALNDPDQRAEVRALLQQRFGTASSKGLKAVLAAAPLEGIELEPDRDLGRNVNL
jgi:hypothetical protein